MYNERVFRRRTGAKTNETYMPELANRILALNKAVAEVQVEKVLCVSN